MKDMNSYKQSQIIIMNNSSRMTNVLTLVTCLLIGTFVAQPGQAACQVDCLPNGNTGFGTNVLLDNSGFDNTAVGEAALPNNTTGSFNTGLGFNALFNNTTGNANTAIGSGA
jgi:hypothetical protein